MIQPWAGVKRIAFIPVWNNQIDIKPADNWFTLVAERIFFDPSPTDGSDRSFQNYLYSVSSGLARMDARLFPIVEASDADTVGAGLASLPPNHGFDHAVIILPHSAGPDRGGFAWYGEAETNGVSNFARVAMYSDVNMTNRDTLGVWMMEILHIVTKFGDLYFTFPNLGKYDVMSCACGTHPSAHTKAYFGWLDSDAILTPTTNKFSHHLHAISLPQPVPWWRSSAIKVQGQESDGYFMVEARLGTDSYESSSEVSTGIPKEGVIIYEVLGPTEVYLRTTTPLQVGDSFEIENEGIIVTVGFAVPGGFSVGIETSARTDCERLKETIPELLDAYLRERSLALLPFNDAHQKKARELLRSLEIAIRNYRDKNCFKVGDLDGEKFINKYLSVSVSNLIENELRKCETEKQDN